MHVLYPLVVLYELSIKMQYFSLNISMFDPMSIDRELDLWSRWPRIITFDGKSLLIFWAIKISRHGNAEAKDTNVSSTEQRYIACDTGGLLQWCRWFRWCGWWWICPMHLFWEIRNARDTNDISEAISDTSHPATFHPSTRIFSRFGDNVK